MLIIRITQILSISLKQRMRLYLFLNTRFPLLKFLWEYLILLAPSPGIFRWLKNGAVSSSAASQEHGAALENRAQQETPRSQLPRLLLTQLCREFIFINTLKLSREEARGDLLAGFLPREGICFRAGACEAAVSAGPSPALGCSPGSLHG